MFGTVVSVRADYRCVRSDAAAIESASAASDRGGGKVMPAKPTDQALEKKLDGLWRSAHQRNSARMCRRVLLLRGVYVKFAQFLSTRADLLPVQWLDCLKVCQASPLRPLQPRPPRGLPPPSPPTVRCAACPAV